jgi:pimeloyl-ACP methyl ester carboxylesterase
MSQVTTGYAPVNGLQMYYEVHGEGRPLVLLHGGLMTIDLSFGGRPTGDRHRAARARAHPRYRP